eukprot:s424_g5.t1
MYSLTLSVAGSNVGSNVQMWLPLSSEISAADDMAATRAFHEICGPSGLRYQCGSTGRSPQRASGEEVEQPKRSLPVTLKEVLPNSTRERATSEAMQHLRQVLTAATDLALENSIETIDRLLQLQSLDVGAMHDHAMNLPDATASGGEGEAVAKIPPSRLVPPSLQTMNIAAGNGSGRLHLPGISDRSDKLSEEHLPSAEIVGSEDR